MQDRKIPVVKIVTSEYGVAVALDLEGNCRVYDMIRLRKICKISCRSLKKNSKERTSWRMLPQVDLLAVADAFMGSIQTDETAETGLRDLNQSVMSDEELSHQRLTEKDVIISAMDAKVENLKSLQEIAKQTKEGPFLMQKSQVYIYRLEDVIFALFPHLAAFRKRGTSSKEVFAQHDPFGKSNMFAKIEQTL